MKRRGFLGMLAGLALMTACGAGFQPARCEAKPRRTPIEHDGIDMWLVWERTATARERLDADPICREIFVCVDGIEVARTPFNDDPKFRLSGALIEAASQQHDPQIIGRLISKANQYIRIDR